MELILTSFRRSHPGSRYVLAAIAICIVSVTSTSSLAQTFQLSPAQQQMLNQLPPAQREQAMDAMRQLESQQMAGSQQSINEPIQQPNSISTDNIENAKALTERVSNGDVAGQSYETIDALNGVVQLDKLSDTHALVVIQPENGSMTLKSIQLP